MDTEGPSYSDAANPDFRWGDDEPEDTGGENIYTQEAMVAAVKAEAARQVQLAMNTTSYSKDTNGTRQSNQKQGGGGAANQKQGGEKGRYQQVRDRGFTEVDSHMGWSCNYCDRKNHGIQDCPLKGFDAWADQPFAHASKRYIEHRIRKGDSHVKRPPKGTITPHPQGLLPVGGIDDPVTANQKSSESDAPCHAGGNNVDPKIQALLDEKDAKIKKLMKFRDEVALNNMQSSGLEGDNMYDGTE